MTAYEKNKEWLTQMMDLFEAHMGPNVELVLHDLTLDYEHTIVDIRNGHVTGREIGGTGDILGLEFIRNPEDTGIYYNCIEYTKDGKTLRSSTRFFRDEEGKPAFSIGINEDITKLVELGQYIQQKTALSSPELSSDYYRGDVQEMLQHLMDSAQLMIGKNTSLMTKEDKMKYIKFLDDHGAFLITYSNAKVCEALDISQFTLYNYLRTLRNERE
ncbi:MAG: transcriptional regulator [Firmicutes bacterium]|nr:transcriptional regulator [Bacillota bacterium]MBR6500263.1 transcriptional regulator [Bacillota bacterium]